MLLLPRLWAGMIPLVLPPAFQHVDLRLTNLEPLDHHHRGEMHQLNPQLVDQHIDEEPLVLHQGEPNHLNLPLADQLIDREVLVRLLGGGALALGTGEGAPVLDCREVQADNSELLPTNLQPLQHPEMFGFDRETALNLEKSPQQQPPLYAGTIATWRTPLWPSSAR